MTPMLTPIYVDAADLPYVIDQLTCASAACVAMDCAIERLQAQIRREQDEGARRLAADLDRARRGDFNPWEV